MYRAFVAVVALALLAVPALASEPAAADDAFRSLEFRFVGPYRGGRATAVTGVAQDPSTFYFGSTGGGVWKTTDAGLTWRNVTDKHQLEEPPPVPSIQGDVDPELARSGLLRPPVEGVPPAPVRKWAERPGDELGSASVGAIAVAPSDPNVVYVGMGSACIRGNVSAGDGIYRSTDGGKSWRHMGLEDAGQIGKIRVHPTDPDIVYAAVLGHAFGPSPDRGVFRSVDGGLSWQKVLFVSAEAGAVDLAMDPSNPRILYAAIWQAVRKPWDFVSGGPGSGIWKTADGGNTWVRLTEGLPEGDLGRIGIAVSPAYPDRVWALVEAAEGGLFRSDDGGSSFRLVTSDRNLLQRAWYYTHLFADPVDPDTVYVLNVAMMKSIDGGKSFRPIRTPHGDNHDLWIHPENPAVMIESNDGGANISTNGGRSWSTQANQPTAEIYRLTIDEQFPYWLYGGQQDNSPVAIPNRAPGGGIGRTDWYEPAGCETSNVAVDPRDPDITYGGCYGGSVTRYDHALGSGMEVTPWPQMGVGRGAKDLRFRFQWNAPIRISPRDPAVLYTTSNVVHRSRDEGMTWEVISPDLTRDDETKQEMAGGPITKDNTSVEVYGTIFAFEDSPYREGLLWAGSDDGRVHVSDDDGATWREITPPAMPEWGTVNKIGLSAHDPGRAFVAVHRYRQDDFRPTIFRTDDYGATWTSLADGTNGIPAHHFVRVVQEDPVREGLLYAGTEYGLYLSLDGGKSWRPFQQNLPVTPVTDLQVKDGDLVLSTQGRGFWVLDDLAPLRDWQDGLGTESPHLFPVRDAITFEGGEGVSFGRDLGQNPEYGAVIRYLLPEDLSEKGAEEVKLEILDAESNVLRTLSSQEEEPTAPSPYRRFFPEFFSPNVLDAKAGMNAYTWDLRLADASLVDTALLWGYAAGPHRPLGEYGARLTVGEWSATTTFEMVPDPRRTEPDLVAASKTRYALAKRIYDGINESHAALRKIRSVREQVDAITGRREDAEAVEEAAKALDEALTPIADRLNQSKAEAMQDILNFTPQLDNELVYLMEIVESARTEPTPASVERFAEIRSELDGLVARLDGVLATELPAFEAAVSESGSGVVVVPED